MALTVEDEDTLTQPEAVAQADSRALPLRLLVAWGDMELLALGAVPLGCALPLAAPLALAVPGGPLEGVRVGWTLRVASDEAVPGGEAVTALALGKGGEGEGAEEALTAALAL